jgi:hypothetical protein
MRRVWEICGWMTRHSEGGRWAEREPTGPRRPWMRPALRPARIPIRAPAGAGDGPRGSGRREARYATQPWAPGSYRPGATAPPACRQRVGVPATGPLADAPGYGVLAKCRRPAHTMVALRFPPAAHPIRPPPVAATDHARLSSGRAAGHRAARSVLCHRTQVSGSDRPAHVRHGRAGHIAFYSAADDATFGAHSGRVSG